MARRSVAYNHLEQRVEIITGDIREATAIFGGSSFDVVTTNPPYMIGGHGLANAESAKAIARHEVLCTLEDVIRESARIVRPGGRFYMVHRPFRLTEILSKMAEAGLEPKRMRMVYPYVDKEPNMVLVEGIRGAKPRMTVEPPLIVYEENGRYTREVLEHYGMDGTGNPVYSG
jgi:tRNA1Val (adenine37-N6)-methyltransferase